GAGGGRGVRGAAQVPPGGDDSWVVYKKNRLAEHVSDGPCQPTHALQSRRVPAFDVGIFVYVGTQSVSCIGKSLHGIQVKSPDTSSSVLVSTRMLEPYPNPIFAILISLYAGITINVLVNLHLFLPTLGSLLTLRIKVKNCFA